MKTILTQLSFLLLSIYGNAQTGLGFENLTAQTFSSPNCLYNDSDFTTTHQLQNFTATCGEIVVQADPTPTELGFDIIWSPTGGNAGSGFSDNDAFGVATSASLASETGQGAPEGSQGFVMEDSDGEVEITFTAVDLTGTTSPQFSIQYILGATSWEVADVFRIYLNITGCGAATELDIVNTTGIDIDGNFTEGSWVTENEDLSSYIGCQAQLVVVYSTNAAAEEAGLDNIVFTEGSIVGPALPVDFISFQAKPTNFGIELIWETAQEENNQVFSVERSFDGQKFHHLTDIDGAGTTRAYRKYSYLDRKIIASPTIYYRLKQIDFDGETTYSKTVVIEMESQERMMILPNPTVSELRINGDIEAFKNWMVTDFFGRIIAEGPLDNDYIDVSYIPSGTYLFKAYSERASKTIRFVKL